MVDTLLKYLREGALGNASIIWHRCQHEFMDRMDHDAIWSIVQAVPPATTLAALAVFLADHLIREMVRLYTPSIEIIAEFTLQKIR